MHDALAIRILTGEGDDTVHKPTACRNDSAIPCPASLLLEGSKDSPLFSTHPRSSAISLVARLGGLTLTLFVEELVKKLGPNVQLRIFSHTSVSSISLLIPL